MEKIEKLWRKILNHPDYIAGNIWTIGDVSSHIECEIQCYLEDEFEIDDIEGEKLELLSRDFIRLNKNKFYDVIYEFESSVYKCETWDAYFEEMEMPKLELYRNILN